MGSVPRECVAEVGAAELGCASRIMTNTAVGFGVGVVGAVGALIFRAPSAAAKLNSGAVFRSLCLEYLPMTTGGAFVYTTVSCVTESNRYKRDWVNPFLGGAATGAIVLGSHKRSPVAAGLGAVIFGVAAAAPEITAALNATPGEVAETAVAPAASASSAVVSPHSFAGSARATSHYVSKLQ